MKTIYKYELQWSAAQVVQLPEEAEILHADRQGGRLCLWAMVDTASPLEARKIRIIQTGTPDADGISHRLDHISTVSVQEYVWHIFEEAR